MAVITKKVNYKTKKSFFDIIFATLHCKTFNQIFKTVFIDPENITFIFRNNPDIMMKNVVL